MEDCKTKRVAIGMLEPLFRLTTGYSGDEWTLWHARRVLRSNKERNTCNKVAFIIHYLFELDHLRGIFAHLPRGSYDIVLVNYKNPFTFWRESCFGMCMSEDVVRKKVKVDSLCRVRTLADVAESDERYSIVFTACWAFFSSFLKGRPSWLADRFFYGAFSFHVCLFSHIRFTFGFDEIFCIGPLQKSIFRDRGLKKVELLDCGSPRLDGRIALEPKVVCKDLEPRKKVIACSFAHSAFKIVRAISVLLKRLSIDYNIVFKFIYFSRREKSVMDLVSRQSGIHVRRDVDNVDVMAIADFVFCDMYGGSLETAIGLDKNVVIIEGSRPVVDCRSFCFKVVRRVAVQLGAFSIDDHDKIAATLKDDAYWERQRIVRAELRKQFFSFHKEPSGKLIADELMRDLRAASERNVKP